MKKKFLLYFLTILIIASIIELFSYLLISQVKNNSFIKTFDEKSKEIKNKAIENYSEFIPYIRDPDKFNELNNFVINKNSENLFYTTINSFDSSNNDNLLIQGDSWSETASTKKISKFLEDYALKNNLGLINSGISSYSPSPMTAQLFVLRKEFSINPSVIICIIDQTDIGDELYRYFTLNRDTLGLNFTKDHINFHTKADKSLNSKNLNFFKMISLIKNYFLLQKKINQNNNLKTIKLLLKKAKYNFNNIPIILSPLYYGLNNEEKKIFVERVNFYLSTAFSDHKLKKIVFVTHPHKKHIIENDETKYILNVSNLIDDIIDSSKYKKKIKHINFNKLDEFKNLDQENKEKIFLKDDIFSHLSDEAYLNYYYPSILKNY
jgi:hypothetical protein